MIMKTYTVFCQQAGGLGTTWIAVVQAKSTESAMKKGVKACAADWGWKPKNIHILGVCKGDVQVLYWDDIEG